MEWRMESWIVATKENLVEAMLAKGFLYSIFLSFANSLSNQKHYDIESNSIHMWMRLENMCACFWYCVPHNNNILLCYAFFAFFESMFFVFFSVFIVTSSLSLLSSISSSPSQFCLRALPEQKCVDNRDLFWKYVTTASVPIHSMNCKFDDGTRSAR